MKEKQRTLINIGGLLLAGIIIFAGIEIPSLLLDHQEREIVGKIKSTTNGNAAFGLSPFSSAGEVAGIFPTTVPALGPLASGMPVDELYAHLLVWNMDGYETYREPFEDELSMEQAVERAKTFIGKLIQFEAIPIISNYRLTGAQLYANIIPLAPDEAYKEIGGIIVPANIGRWILSFEAPENKGGITITCDAIRGTVYEVNVMGDESASIIDPKQVVSLFVSYYNLSDDGSVQEETMEKAISDRFVLSYASTNANSYKISISLKS